MKTYSKEEIECADCENIAEIQCEECATKFCISCASKQYDYICPVCSPRNIKILCEERQ